MKENTYVENMRAPALPQVPLPSAFSFKEGGSLAAHHLSFHPQVASEKMKRKTGACSTSLPKLY